MHNQIIKSVDRVKDNSGIIHTEGDTDRSSNKTGKLKKNFDIIKEDDEYKLSLMKVPRSPLKISNFMTKITTVKQNPNTKQPLTDRYTTNPSNERTKKSRNEKKNKNIGMNLTFTEKPTGHLAGQVSHIRHTSDPEYLRMATQGASNSKKIQNTSFQTEGKAEKSAKNNNSMTPRLRTNNNWTSKPKKKEINVSFRKNDSKGSGKESGIQNKTSLDHSNVADVSAMHANYLDTMQSQASSSSSRKNSFNINPSYLHYFKEKKKKTNKEQKGGLDTSGKKGIT